MSDIKRKPLTVQPIPEVYFQEYTHFVQTPEGEVMYFKDQKKARSFIEFYKNHKGKKIAKVVNSYIEYR